MAKKALLDVLEQTIGKYVRNLDAESLNVAVWSGKIDLNALELDCDAVNAELAHHAAEAPNLALPFRVVSGEFGHFQVEVPWAHISSRPVILRASGLKVAVEPFDRTASADFLYAVHDNESVRARKVQEQRINSLEMADNYRKQANVLKELAAQDLEAAQSAQSTSNADGSKKDSTFAARLVRRIIENIQIEISGVHVTVQGSDYSAGVMLQELSLVTTDLYYKPTFVDRTKAGSSFLYKMLHIAGLAVYLDGEVSKTPHLFSIGEESDELQTNHSYLLAPLSFEAKLRQADSNKCIDYPKYLLTSELSSLSILLSRTQLEISNKIAQEIRPAVGVANPLFPQYRPLQRVTKETAAEWWKYAARCVGRLNGRRSWVEFFRAFRIRKRYIPLYKRHAFHESCSWIKALSPDEIQELERIETDRSISVEGIMTWRNIADAQVKKEQEKHNASQSSKTKGSVFTSLFGTKQTADAESTDDAPPIALSVEELQELENMTMGQVSDSDLSSDSRLCDVKFLLQSLRINLSSYDQRPLTSLDMGAVSTTFDANQDGSFNFHLDLTSLEIQDRVTPNSLFPAILKNHIATNEDDPKTFSFRLSKTTNGHQHLRVKLETFEAVASPKLVKELHQFFSLPSQGMGPPKPAAANPILTQSLSGSIDLFYDASSGDPPSSEDKVADRTVGNLEALHSANMDDFSSALIDAWKTKTESKTAWVVDLDLQAPIIVVPENCTVPRANVLVFDLGHLQFQYGQKDSSPRVEEWFRSNLRSNAISAGTLFENGSLRVTSLTFAIGKANYLQRLIHKQGGSGAPHDDEAVIEPISLSVDFAVESVPHDPKPRVCLIGILPAISLRISPSQLSRMLVVSNTWKHLLHDLSPKEIDADDDASHASRSSRSSQILAKLGSLGESRETIRTKDSEQVLSPTSFPAFHGSIRLNRFSVKVLNDNEHGIEAHLISVSASSTFLSNGASSSNLSMGWFWILDRLENDFPRRQRLVAHSALPASADEFASRDQYAIIDVLQSRGVFADEFAGSSDLADITLKQAPTGGTFGATDPFDSDDLKGEDFNVSSILVAKFTSLFINWNPRAVKSILLALQSFSKTLKTNSESETERLILSEPAQLKRRRSLSLDSSVQIEAVNKVNDTGNTLIRAQMDGFQVALNSARDDLPIFTGHMVSTRISMALGAATGDTRVDLELGELKLVSPNMGETSAPYRTILGLVEGKSDSLLSVRYYAGPRAIASISSKSSKKKSISECEAYGEIALSPMRMVYIQAQVLALVEYATAGILGALTAQAASSAMNKAAELASSAESKKVFKVSASGMTLLLPQAAYRSEFVSVGLDSLSVCYTSMPDSSGVAQISLQEVSMQGSDEESLLEDPINMDINVLLPPIGVGTKDDQAMRVNLTLSKANFVLAKPQYQQILATFDGNIGDVDLHLRDDSSSLFDADEDDSSIEGVLDGGLTHAGVEIVDDPRHMQILLAIHVLSLQLNGIDKYDPLIQLSAVDSVIEMKTVPDEGRMSVRLSLRDLVCDDQRPKVMSRQYRSLIYQPHSGGGKSENGNDVFLVSYESNNDDSSSVDLQIGSPRIVYIPDVIADLLDFVRVDRPGRVEQEESQQKPQNDGYREVVKIGETSGRDDESGIEASVFLERKPSPVSSMLFSMKTANCSVLLVDLGSDSLRRTGGMGLSSSVSSVSETIVFGGSFEAKVSMISSKETGEVIEMDTQFHGDALEAYTAFGRDLHSAVQILDPTQLSLYVSTKSSVEEGKATDVRFAVIEPIDLILSMQNVALINAIMTSTSDCFAEYDIEDGDNVFGMSQQETERIEKLATVLETPSGDVSYSTQESSLSTDGAGSIASSSHDVSVSTRNEVTVKVTTPEMKFTVINDLQGADDALLRFNFRNFVANGRLGNVDRGKNDFSYTAWDCNVHTSILADYFDSSTSMWKVLLLEPWELSVKGNRGETLRFKSKRPSTTIDIESFQCKLSFSEQFLMSLASANQMWNVYSAASSSALESVDQDSRKSKSVRRSLAASAARTFVSSLPYAIDNHAGIDLELVISGETPERRLCRSGSIEYFRFEPPAGAGIGGKRLYGQDVKFDRAVSLLVGDQRIHVSHIDSKLGAPKVSHHLADNRLIMTDVVKEGKTTVLHISSGVDVYNRSSIPFVVSGFRDGKAHEVGTCAGTRFESFSKHPASALQVGAVDKGKISKPTRRFGIPVDLVDNFRSSWNARSDAVLFLAFSPQIECPHEGWEWSGGTKLKIDGNTFSALSENNVAKKFDITCRPVSLKGADASETPRDLYAFVLQAQVSMELVSGTDPCIEISLEPRAVLKNHLPISIAIKTPMPHVFGRSSAGKFSQGDDVVLDIEPHSHVEVFTGGRSIAVMIKCSDLPVGGTATTWMDGGWVDLPLVPEFRFHEPIDCMFPFVKKSDPLSLAGSKGCGFTIAEGSERLAAISLKRTPDSSEGSNAVELRAPPSIDEDWRTFYVTVCNYAIDHTGDILFEQLAPSREAALRRSSTDIDSSRKVQSTQVSPPIGAYSTRRHRGRISLLPASTAPIRLLHLTMEGDEGLQRSAPFRIEDISICDGGAESTPLTWTNEKFSGFFAYRQLVSSYQSEIHIIPEFVVFNGSTKHHVRVRQPGGLDMDIEPSKITPLRTQGGETAIITVEIPELGGQTRPVRIDSLGLRMAIVKASDGSSIGSVAVQTVVGARDSRFVVKLGEVKFGSLGAPGATDSSPYATIRHDCLRFRVKWTELQMTLNEARPITTTSHAFIETALDRIKKTSPADGTHSAKGMSPTKEDTWVKAREKRTKSELSLSSDGEKRICKIIFQRFTIDWQRVFKEEPKSAREALESSERSQLSIIIAQAQLKDEAPETAYPNVFYSSSQKANLLDFCIRFRGDLDADIVKVDLLDIKLSHLNGKSEEIVLNTSEDFVWKLLDLANRIIDAAAEFAGVEIELEWDEKHEGYVVAIKEKQSSYIEDEVKYTPPKSDKIYNIKKTRVSPFKMVVSFERNPQASRYKLLQGGKTANLMNYFTRHLKFQIKKAELGFSHYEVNDVKGPPDRIIELVSNVYLARMKTKIVTIMTAASFQDWKFLTARQEGTDEYVEGDLFRATGNLAGNSASYVIGRTGRGLGKGVSHVASTIGGGIESATSAIGARAVGAGVNSLVSGVGSGVGDTITGVGSGAGKFVKGAGQGVGQVFGGMTGGALLVGKGIGKGITQGDGRAVVSGIGAGAASVGTGVGQGVESVVTGATDGVLSVGHGLFSGVKNVGRGIGGAFSECCRCCGGFWCCCGEEEEEANNRSNTRNSITSPLLPRGNAGPPP